MMQQQPCTMSVGQWFPNQGKQEHKMKTTWGTTLQMTMTTAQFSHTAKIA